MRSFTRFVVWVALLIGLLIGVARATAIRWWRVPDNDPYLEASVAPSLRGGDLILLWRLTKPSYGDLVLCPEPAAESDEQQEESEPATVESTGRVVIGRIIGEAGDDIEIKGGRFQVNGRAVTTESGCNDRKFTVHDPESENELEQFCSLERLGSNVHMVGGAGPETLAPPDRGGIEVNGGQVWLASDNRMFPYDSRDYGGVERDSCKETVVFRLVSAEGFFDTKNRLTLIR